MNRRWVIPVITLFLLMIIPIIYFTTALKVETNFKSSGDKFEVLPNKTWRITFSDSLRAESINESNIFVVNDQGEKIKTTLTYDDIRKNIIIHPPLEGYEAKINYSLHIDRKTESVNGRGLWKDTRVDFFVKETLPVIGSKKSLYNHFNEIFKKHKSSNSSFWGREKAVFESADSSGAPATKMDSSNNNYAVTNNQVEGIDEADIIKTNSTHIFQILDGDVQIIRAFPANEMRIDATISYEHEFYPVSIFQDNMHLVVLGNGSHYSTFNKSNLDRMAPAFYSTKALIYDIIDPTNPILIREIEIEGHLIQARKKGDTVYLVSSYYPDIWVLEKQKDAELRPRYRDSSSGSKNPQFVDYKEIQLIPNSQEANYSMITSFDLNNVKSKLNITTFLGSGDQLYMSENNLYLGVTNYHVNRSLLNDNSLQTTSIYKFSVQGTDVGFHSSTEVPGVVLNQFSMDEHAGNFRVATTEGHVWSEDNPSANHLFIFDENLVEIGSLKDLARGERIYSARFIGNKIYIVTFRETDPLFVIDATNPKRPTVLGELKIPGFSNYLHPLDENHLIGFGQDTMILPEKGANGQPRIITNGVKISLFDVRDMKNPKEKFSTVIGGNGTYSPLNHDHKALMYHRGYSLLAFPISVYETTNEMTRFSFQGAYVYKVDTEKGFTLQDKITHINNQAPYEEWENSIQRLTYINENLYALSPKVISVHSLTDFKQVNKLMVGNKK